MPVTFTYPTSRDLLNPLYYFNPDSSGTRFTCTGNCKVSWNVQTCYNATLYWNSPVGYYYAINDAAAAKAVASGQTSATLGEIYLKYFDPKNYGKQYELMMGCWNLSTSSLEQSHSVSFYAFINYWNYGSGTVALPSTSSSRPSSTSTTATTTAASSNNTATPDPSPDTKLSTGAIVGIVIGAIALIGLVLGILIVRRRKQKKLALNTGPQAQNNINYTSQGSNANTGYSSAKPELAGTAMAGNLAREKSELSASDPKMLPSVNHKALTETSSESGAMSAVRYAHMSMNQDEKQVSEAERHESQLPEHLSYQPYQIQKGHAELGQYTREAAYIPYSRNSATPELGQNSQQGGFTPYQQFTGTAELGDYRPEPGYAPYHPATNVQSSTSDSVNATSTRFSAPNSPAQQSNPSGPEDINALKAQNRELQRQIEVNESLQRLRLEQAALEERIRLAEMQAREQGQ